MKKGLEAEFLGVRQVVRGVLDWPVLSQRCGCAGALGTEAGRGRSSAIRERIVLRWTLFGNKIQVCCVVALSAKIPKGVAVDQ